MATFAEVVKRLEQIEQRNAKLESEVKQLRADAQKAGVSTSGSSKAAQAQRNTGGSYGEQLSARAGFFGTANPISRQWQGMRQKGIDSVPGLNQTMGYFDTLSQMSNKKGLAGAIGKGAGVANKALGAAAGTLQAFADGGAISGEIIKFFGSALGQEMLGKWFGELTGVMAGEARKFFAEVGAKLSVTQQASEARDARIRMGGKEAVLGDLKGFMGGGGKTYDSAVEMESEDAQFEGMLTARKQAELFKKRMERGETLESLGESAWGHLTRMDGAGLMTDAAAAYEEARKNLFKLGGSINQGLNDLKKSLEHVGG